MNSAFLTLSIVSAASLAVAYQPMLTKLSVGLVTPYAKVDVKKRFLAAIIDVMLVGTVFAAYRGTNVWVYMLTGAYLFVRDSIAGRSVGKLLCGLVVIDLRTGLPCGAGRSLQRNVLFMLPGANLVAAFLEARTVLRDRQGQRLGDRLALTQVVEGLGSKDLVTVIQARLLDVLADLNGRAHQPRRAPVRVPRVAA